MRKLNTLLKTLTLCTLVAVPLSLPQTALASDNGVLAVSGTAEIFVKPDLAKLRVGAVFTEKTPEEARNRVEKVITDFIGKLAKSGISEKSYSAQNISVVPTYDYIDGKRILRGYSAKRSVKLRLDRLSAQMPLTLMPSISFIRSGLHGWMVIMASEIFSTPAMRSLLLRRRS